MKTILKIITILLVASVVAGGFVLAMNKTSSAFSLIEGDQPPSMAAVNYQLAGQPMARPEGGENETSISHGLSGIFFTLIELTGITAIVLLLENLISMLRNRKIHSPQR